MKFFKTLPSGWKKITIQILKWPMCWTHTVKNLMTMVTDIYCQDLYYNCLGHKLPRIKTQYLLSGNSKITILQYLKHQFLLARLNISCIIWSEWLISLELIVASIGQNDWLYQNWPLPAVVRFQLILSESTKMTIYRVLEIFT